MDEMRKKLTGLAAKYIDNTPESLNLVDRDAMIEAMVDDLIITGLCDFKYDMPYKVPLEGVIKYQDKQMRKMKVQLSEKTFALHNKGIELAKALKLTPEEKRKQQKEVEIIRLKNTIENLKRKCNTLQEQKNQLINTNLRNIKQGGA